MDQNPIKQKLEEAYGLVDEMFLTVKQAKTDPSKLDALEASVELLSGLFEEIVNSLSEQKPQPQVEKKPAVRPKLYGLSVVYSKRMAG